MGLKQLHLRGLSVAQSVKRPTPDFVSGHDCTVREFEPCIGLSVHCQCRACLTFFPSLSLLPLSAPSPSRARSRCLSLSLQVNKT